MVQNVYAALCLVLVIEGLLLAVAPRGWQNLVRQAAELPPSVLRKYGAAAVIGLVVLLWVWR